LDIRDTDPEVTVRSRRFLFALACVGAGCRETPVDPLEGIVPVPAGQSASASIGAMGGLVELVSSDGARFRLDVPAGALDSVTSITIRTHEASRAQRFVLRFAPEGLAFRTPATITVDLPSAQVIAPTGTLTYNSVPLAVDRLVGGGIRASVRRFARLVSRSADIKATLPERAHTSPAAPPCAGWSDDDTFVRGGLVAADAVPITTYGECAFLNVGDVVSSGEYADAVQLADATDALLQRAEQVESGEWLQLFQERSCYLLTYYVSLQPEPQVEAYGRLRRRLGGAYHTARHVQRVGGTCAALDTYPAAVDLALGAIVAYYASREGAITSIATIEYEDAVGEARAGADLLRELSTLGAGDDVMVHATRAVREVAHPALLDVLLPAAIGSCGATGNTTALLRLHSIMGPLPALLTALQNCVPN
jgi:hypothetical protein